jgi:hypothetical protein
MLGRLAVFAVEDTAIQVTWRGLPAGTQVLAGDDTATVTDEGPGAAALGGLPHETEVSVRIRPPGRAEVVAARARTLAPPPGELLTRLATVSDLHIGERRFGLTGRIRDPAAPGSVETYALRCARAAVAEAVAWGAKTLVAKGDLTWSGRTGQWTAAADLLGSAGVPAHALLGNHDVGRRGIDGRRVLRAAGVDAPVEPTAVDLPGLRVVLVDSTIPRHHQGRLLPTHRGATLDLAAAAPKEAGVLVMMHHDLQRRERATHYPPGIPASEADPFLDALAAVRPASMITTGHTHRHRLRRHGPLLLTEVGATMHWPGTWAGYAVHEGGIRQVVRRVAAPEAIAWTDRTRWALLGIWGLYSPGPLSHRCFTHPWL